MLPINGPVGESSLTVPGEREGGPTSAIAAKWQEMPVASRTWCVDRHRGRRNAPHGTVGWMLLGC